MRANKKSANNHAPLAPTFSLVTLVHSSVLSLDMVRCVSMVGREEGWIERSRNDGSGASLPFFLFLRWLDRSLKTESPLETFPSFLPRALYVQPNVLGCDEINDGGVFDRQANTRLPRMSAPPYLSWLILIHHWVEDLPSPPAHPPLRSLLSSLCALPPSLITANGRFPMDVQLSLSFSSNQVAMESSSSLIPSSLSVQPFATPTLQFVSGEQRCTHSRKVWTSTVQFKTWHIG